MFGRWFLQNDDSQPAAELTRSYTKVYAYGAGGAGTSYASFLRGETRLGALTAPPETVFHDRSGRVINTVPPNDYGYCESRHGP